MGVGFVQHERPIVTKARRNCTERVEAPAAPVSPCDRGDRCVPRESNRGFPRSARHILEIFRLDRARDRGYPRAVGDDGAMRVARCAVRRRSRGGSCGWCGLDDDAVDRRRRAHPSPDLSCGVYLVGHQAAHSVRAAHGGAARRRSRRRCSASTRQRGCTTTRPSPTASSTSSTRDIAPSRKGLRFHVGTTNEPVFLDALPLTSPARTVVDMATVLSPHEASNLVDRALMTDHLTPEALEQAIVPRRRNVQVLREILEIGEDLARARSQAEQRLFRAAQAGRAAEARGQRQSGGPRVRLRLVPRAADPRVRQLAVPPLAGAVRERPREDAAAQAAGFRVERMVRHDLYNEPEGCL